MYIGRTWLHLAAPWQWCVAWQTAGMTARVRGPPPHRSSWDSRGRVVRARASRCSLGIHCLNLCTQGSASQPACTQHERRPRGC